MLSSVELGTLRDDWLGPSAKDETRQPAWFRHEFLANSSLLTVSHLDTRCPDPKWGHRVGPPDDSTPDHQLQRLQIDNKPLQRCFPHRSTLHWRWH